MQVRVWPAGHGVTKVLQQQTRGHHCRPHALCWAEPAIVAAESPGAHRPQPNPAGLYTGPGSRPEAPLQLLLSSSRPPAAAVSQT